MYDYDLNEFKDLIIMFFQMDNNNVETVDNENHGKTINSQIQILHFRRNLKDLGYSDLHLYHQNICINGIKFSLLSMNIFSRNSATKTMISMIGIEYFLS